MYFRFFFLFKVIHVKMDMRSWPGAIIRKIYLWVFQKSFNLLIYINGSHNILFIMWSMYLLITPLLICEQSELSERIVDKNRMAQALREHLKWLSYTHTHAYAEYCVHTDTHMSQVKASSDSHQEGTVNKEVWLFGIYKCSSKQKWRPQGTS